MLDLHPAHYDKSLNVSKQDKIVAGPSKTVGHTTIDLLKTDEDEVRLDLMDDHPGSMMKIQNIYKNIKSTGNSSQMTIKKSVKYFFSSKHKESQRKATKNKSIDRKTPKKSIESKIFQSYIIDFSMSKELGKMIYNTLKQEISANNSKTNSANISASQMVDSLDAADLLIYRGEKYKENKLKLKEKLSQKEFEHCTFQPEVNQRPVKRPHKVRNIGPSQGSLEKIKHRMNGALVKYMNPADSSKTSIRVSELNSKIPSSRISYDNAQQSTTFNVGESERHQVEDGGYEIPEQNDMQSQRINTEESDTKSLTKYLQNKMYLATESSISNSGDF